MIKLAWTMLPKRSRQEALFVLGCFILTAVNEAFGVAFVLPFMMVVSQPETLLSNEMVRAAYSLLGFADPKHFVASLGLLLLAVLAAGNLLSIATTRLSLRFVAKEQARLSSLLMQHYLSQPYSWFLHKNSSELYRNVQSEAPAVASGFILPLMRLISRGLVVLLLVSGLVAINPKIALGTLTLLGGSYYAIWGFVKHQSSQLGAARMQNDMAKGKIVLEALGGIKPVIVLGREKSFLQQFSSKALQSGRIQASQGFLNEVPRSILETLAFGGVVSVITLFTLNGHDIKAIIPTLSVFTLAAYRLMPALQQSFNYAIALKFYSPTVQTIHREFSNRQTDQMKSSSSTTEHVTFQRTIRLVQLSFSYENADKPTLRDLDLEIRKFTSVAFVGTTGSGKTTLVDLILGLLKPTSGKVLIDDTPLDTQDKVRSWQCHLGYVSQEIFLIDASIAENIAFGLAPEHIDTTAVVNAARLAKIHDFISSLPDGYQTTVGERGMRLSGGQRQRIGIARALYRDPSVLILDEATSSLDGATENAIMESVSELAQQKTLIIVAHRLTTIQNCDHIYFLDNGFITASGTYQQLLSTHQGFQSIANQRRTMQRPTSSIESPAHSELPLA